MKQLQKNSRRFSAVQPAPQLCLVENPCTNDGSAGRNDGSAVHDANVGSGYVMKVDGFFSQSSVPESYTPSVFLEQYTRMPRRSYFCCVCIIGFVSRHWFMTNASMAACTITGDFFLLAEYSKDA